MPYRPRGVRRNVLALAGGAALLTLGLVPSASAETLLTGPDAPLIVQGKACVGEECPTTAPSMTFEVRNRDTPLVRLDQNGLGGFTPQAWDVGGNEANFFVRDLTGGSRLPFRIRPGAPTSNLTLGAGRVGVNTWDPEATLDVTRNDGTAELLVREESATVERRTLATLRNNGPVALRLSDADADVDWSMATAADGTLALTPGGPGPLPSLVLSGSGAVAARGSVSTGGTLEQTADPDRQTGIERVEPSAVLDGIRALSIERFGLDGDAPGVHHLAPNGAAFRAAFGLGASDARIAPGDIGSVALVGVQALLNGEAAIGDRVAETTETTSELVERVAAQGSRIATSEQVAHGHEQRMRKLEQQATLAETRFRRSSRVQRRLSSEISSLRTENQRLERRLAAIEAALAKRR